MFWLPHYMLSKYLTLSKMLLSSITSLSRSAMTTRRLWSCEQRMSKTVMSGWRPSHRPGTSHTWPFTYIYKVSCGCPEEEDFVENICEFTISQFNQSVKYMYNPNSRHHKNKEFKSNNVVQTFHAASVFQKLKALQMLCPLEIMTLFCLTWNLPFCCESPVKQSTASFKTTSSWIITWKCVIIIV